MDDTTFTLQDNLLKAISEALHQFSIFGTFSSWVDERFRNLCLLSCRYVCVNVVTNLSSKCLMYFSTAFLLVCVVVLKTFLSDCRKRSFRDLLCIYLPVIWQTAEAKSGSNQKNTQNATQIYASLHLFTLPDGATSYETLLVFSTSTSSF